MTDTYRILVPECAPAASGAKRRILMLAYKFPPYPSGVAFRRPEGLYKHLAEFGYEPMVVTVRREGTPPGVFETEDISWLGRIEQEGSAAQITNKAIRSTREGGFRRKVMSGLKKMARILPKHHDECAEWSYSLPGQVIPRFRDSGIDVVWATCGPFTLAPAAIEIARALKVPCVVDLRDPLPDYLYFPRSPSHWFYRAVRHADAVACAAPSCITADLMAVRDREPYMIIHGSWTEGVTPARPTAKFTLLHAGHWYADYTGEVLFNAVGGLLDSEPGFRNDVELRFVGRNNLTIADSPGYDRVAAVTTLSDQVPQDQIAPMLDQAAIVVFLRGTAPARADAVLGKTFEGIRSAKPVLSIGGNPGMHPDLINWAGGALWTNDADECTEFLRAAYKRWKQTGTLAADRDPAALTYLTQRRMAGEFAEVFNALIDGRRVSLHATPPWQKG